MFDRDKIFREALQSCVDFFAFQADHPGAVPLPATVSKMRCALSLLTEGDPSVEELRPFIGANWMISRRTKDVIRRYGSDVNCITMKKLDAAYEAAARARFPT